jgi:hypothetical protein
MATMRCPECGREYGLSATRCTTCDHELVETLAGDEPFDDTVGLVDDTSIDEDEAGEDAVVEDVDDTDEHVTYELSDWSREARVMLEQLLSGADIVRAWEGGDLVVRADDEQAVDELVDQVRATDRPALDPDAEKIVYEVSDWSGDQLATLTDALAARGIAYEFDVDGDLVVLATDEQGVEALLDEIEFGTGGDAVDDAESAADLGDPDDGLETAEILSDLFVACDRLQKHASDHAGVLGAVAAAEKLEDRAIPFGYEPPVWREIQADAARLRLDLEGDEATDIDIQLRAKAVRSRLRDFV